MNRYLIHIMIFFMSVISYIYLNNIIISLITMCSIFFIKMICCNRSITDSDAVSEPSSVSVPFDDVKKIASSVENVIEDILTPQTKTVKDIAKLFDKKKD